jgi:hypothetical protein
MGEPLSRGFDGICRTHFVGGQALIKDKLGVPWTLSSTVSGQTVLQRGGDADATFTE